jgi:hypothetical protein
MAQDQMIRAEAISAIIDKINDGDVPSFDEVGAVFPDMKCLFRMACFGSSDAAMAVASSILGGEYQWHVGYDNRAVVRHKSDPMGGVVAISVTPGHALILAVLQAKLKELTE